MSASDSAKAVREAATRYIRRGFAVVPVEDGKNPNRPSWEKLRITEEQVSEFFIGDQNIGLILGEPSGGLVDVDLDVPEAVAIAGKFLPLTLTSGRESAWDSHWWYMAAGTACEKFKDLDAKMLVELRSTGMQTLVYPSKHPDSGELYQWSESGLDIAEVMPGELHAACRKLATATLIARHLPPIGGRHDFALALAGYLLRPARLDEQDTLHILKAAWDAAGWPDEKSKRDAYRDLEGIVRDTATSIRAGVPVVGGTTLDEAVPGLPRRLARFWQWDDTVYTTDAYSKASLKDGHNPPAWHKRTISAAELVSKEFEPPRWAVPDILPAGLSILAAKPKIGKSWLAYGVCVAVATGGVALGTKPVEKGEALYLALEDNERRLKKRLKTLLGGDTAPDGLHIATEWPTIGEGGVEELDAWLCDYPAARVVVIDTLKKFRLRSGGNRNLYDVDYESVEPLVPVAAEHNVAILLVHHSNKQVDPADPFDVISGSTGLTGGVDSALVLSRERGAADAFLYVDGRDIEEAAELALTWDQHRASWWLKGDAEEYRMSKERRAIYNTVKDSSERITPKEVAEVLDKKEGTVRKMMWEMSRDGQLRSEGGGYWVEENGNNGNSGNSDVTGVTGPARGGNPENPFGSEENQGAVTEVTKVTEDAGYPCLHGAPDLGTS